MYEYFTDKYNYIKVYAQFFLYLSVHVQRFNF
jgi:hypothetical protein